MIIDTSPIVNGAAAWAAVFGLLTVLAWIGDQFGGRPS